MKQSRPALRSIRPPLFRLVASCAVVVGIASAIPSDAFGTPPASAENASALDAATESEVAVLLKNLDADRGDVRERAAKRLAAIVDKSPTSQALATCLRRAALAENASFELQARLQSLLAKLPAAPVPTEQLATLSELPRLIAQLESESFGARRVAADRLAASMRIPENICPTLNALRDKLADPDLDIGARRELAPLWKKVRAAWLTSDPATWSLPAVSDEQIQGWVAELLKAPPAGWRGVYPPHETARRELMDLLARDEYVQPVRAAVEQRLNDPFSAGTYYLQDIFTSSLPGLVAEIWTDSLHGATIATVQYLALNVPCHPSEAANPSLFDRCDDEQAHCLSGNSLSEGDWPVGVAFPSPLADDKFFHLVNLPTPRQRLAYEATVDSDEGERLRKLSERTLNKILAAARPLTFAETLMLDKLDSNEVAKFAGPYFLAVDDQLFPADARHTPTGRASLHQAICFYLAQYGDHAALPGIQQAIDRKRFLAPESGNGFNWPWIAALAIAVRSPGIEIDRWLGSQVLRTEPLVIGPDPSVLSPEIRLPGIPDVGATAAAILLARHELPPWAFRLDRVWQPALDGFDLPSCRFLVDSDRQEVLRWWNKSGSTAAGIEVPPAPPAANP